MCAKPRRGGLGKGLDALFADNDTGSASIVTLRVAEIEPNKMQPRKDFDETALADLADSIRQHGVLQPLLVRPLAGGSYQVVAGERRWRAARMAGLSEVPVVIRELSESETMELALIENLQREDLNPIEEALGYRALADEHGMTQEQIAQAMGRSRPVIANALRLLNLPEEVVEMVREDKISAGHARALLGLEDSEQVLDTARRIVRDDLTVRDIEKMGKRRERPARRAKLAAEDNFYSELELALVSVLGRRVKIKEHAGKGQLELEFFDKSDLADIAGRLTGEKVSFE